MARDQRTYIALIWEWLRDGENRKVIAWIGSGLVVLLGAVLYQSAGPGADPPTPSQSTTVGTGIGTTGDVQVEGDVTIGGGSEENVERRQK